MDLREIPEPASAIEENEIEKRLNDLLCFACRSEHLMLTGTEQIEQDNRASTDHPNLQIRRNGRSDHHRLRELLDALASASVEGPRQVNAVGARLVKKAGNFHTFLLVSSTHEVSDKVMCHLAHIWMLLRESVNERTRLTSAQCMKSGRTPPNDDDENPPIELERLHSRLFELVLVFTWARSRRRWQRKEHRVGAFPFALFHENVWMQTLKLSLDRLGTEFEYQHPACDFVLLWQDLQVIKKAWQQLFIRTTNWKEFATQKGYAQQWADLDKYVRKILLIPNTISTLAQLTRSPRCVGIFKGKITLMKLSSEVYLPPSALPQTMEQWQNRVETFLADHLDFESQCFSSDYVDKESDPAYIPQACSELAAQSFAPQGVVHAEARILAYFLRYPRQRFYPYVGVSKLSCRACHIFSAAVTKFLRRVISTTGCSQKWDYPWKLPDLGRTLRPQRSEIATETYRLLLAAFVSDCRGLRVKSDPMLSNSTSGRESTELDAEADQAEALRVLEFIRSHPIIREDP